MLVRHLSTLQQATGKEIRRNSLLLRPTASSRSAAASNQPLSTCLTMEDDVEQLVHSIHRCQTKVAVVVTGGGSQAISWLLSVPGASATVVEATVPYSRGSLMQLLGQMLHDPEDMFAHATYLPPSQEPAQYCSADTAVSLAKAAYRRAAALTGFGAPVVGLAATCALASEPPKRGDHRAYIAAHSSSGSRLLSIKLAKGSRSRWQEEQLVGRLLLKVLAESCDIDPGLLQLQLWPASITPAAATSAATDPTTTSTTAAGPQDVLQCELLSASDPLQDLLDGRIRCVEYSGGQVFADAPRSAYKVYLPGSFNPLHEGHKALLKAAVQAAAGSSSSADVEGCFELTAINADKGHLEINVIRQRVKQFTDLGLPVLVTAAPLLVDKARLLPGAMFVLGWDTAVRIVMPKYYGNTEVGLQLTFAEIRHHGCKFLVAGRVDDKGDGRFKTLADIVVPPEMADLFEGIPESVFRSDLSSTALRAMGDGLKA